MRTSFTKSFAAIAAILLAALLALPAYAILVRPIVIDMQSMGSRASSAIEVTNDRNRPMAVEIKVQTFTLPEQGPLEMQPNDGKDFLIFPTIANIPPGGKQVFRVRYVGNPAIPQSKLFMFSSSELPVSDDGQNAKGEVQMLYAINSIVTVTPPKAKYEISVIGTEPFTNNEGVKGLLLTFENRGAALGYVGNSSIALSGNGWSKLVEPDQSAKAFGLGLIPPRAKRKLFLPMSDAPSGPVKVELRESTAA